MQAAKREAKAQRSIAWFTAALPLFKRFPSYDSFVNPSSGAADRMGPPSPAEVAGYMRGVSRDAPPPGWSPTEPRTPAQVADWQARAKKQGSSHAC